MFWKKGMQITALIVCLVMAACVDSNSVQSQESGPKDYEYRESKTTYVYKQVGDLKIMADVLQVEDDVARPVVVWIHGGALMTGGRDSVPKWAKTSLFASGYDIISIDYRLAPETKLPEIIADLEDVFKWIQKEGPVLLGIDTSRIAVVGGSAGGYLALTAGYRVNPRPTVIVSQWGYGDLIGPWQLEPSPHPRHNMGQPMAEEDFQAITKMPPVANAGDRTGGNVWAFYNVCRQKGLWPLMATDWDPHQEPEKFYPYMPLKNVTPEFPPTLLIHGQDDTDVPHEQSELMEQEFIKHNVPYEFFSVEGAEHGLQPGPWDKIRESQALLVEFIDKYMKNKTPG